jgi:hypothetical protein
MLEDFDLITVFRWFDNNMFVKEVNSPLEMSEIIKQSDKIGVQTNKEKGSNFSNR